MRQHRVEQFDGNSVKHECCVHMLSEIPAWGRRFFGHLSYPMLTQFDQHRLASMGSELSCASVVKHRYPAVYKRETANIW